MGEPHILSSSATLPAYYVDQETLLGAFREQWAEKHFNVERLEQLHRAVRVGGRHLALPLERIRSRSGTMRGSRRRSTSARPR